jgi:hypothetical protein
MSSRTKAILQVILFSEVAVSLLSCTRSYFGETLIVKGGRRLVGWELSVEILKDMHILRILVALCFMILVSWTIRKGKKWAVPFVLILLVHAALYLVWDCMPWAWVYEDNFGKMIRISEIGIVLTCLILLFLLRSQSVFKNRDLAKVGLAAVAATTMIYVKGHFSFCCPEYGREPAMWWVYFDISGLWDRPRETGLLIAWGCYAATIGLLWGLGKSLPRFIKL